MRGVILAGGQSKRMGSDKALLRVEGQRVLSRNLALLKAVCGDAFVVARDAAQAGSLQMPDATIVTDVIPECGPLGGLYTAFEHTEDDLFVLACDLPFLEEPLLKRLAGEFVRHRPRVLLPHTADGDQPLCAIWSRVCRADIATALNARDLALYKLLKTWPDVRRVEMAAQESHQFRNINSPQDL